MNSSSLYSSSNLNTLAKASSDVTVLAIWTIIAIIVAICGGIALYFTFLSKKNDGKYNGFLGWLYDTLSFKKMYSEVLLKIIYIIATIFITLYSFGLVAVNVLEAFELLILGNLGLRIGYEFLLMIITLCKDVSNINSKLNGTKKSTEEKE